MWRGEGKVVGGSEGFVLFRVGLCAAGVLRDRATLGAIISIVVILTSITTTTTGFYVSHSPSMSAISF